MKRVECLKIRLFKAKLEENIFDINSLKVIKEINCDRIGMSLTPKTILADPFLFVNNDKLHLFFEDKQYMRNGVISMISTSDLITWSKPKIVLMEDCHLSYPYVFKDKEKIYMIPETCEKKSVRLYEANADLTSFCYVNTLLKSDYNYDISFSDSSVKYSGGKYFLMTTVSDGTNTLKLYISDDLEGPYMEHIMSPLTKSNRYGRNAGSIFEYAGNLYRVAQDCDKGYGENVHLFKIKSMAENFYDEELVKQNLFDRRKGFYKDGGHQFNIVKFHDSNIIATDAKEYHSFILCKIANRVIKDIKKCLWVIK